MQHLPTLSRPTEPLWAGWARLRQPPPWPPVAPRPTPLIRSIGEFVDCLQQLINGHVLVRVSDLAGWTTLAGAAVYFSFDVLEGYGLIQEFQVLDGLFGVRYFRISPIGRDFALTVLAQWASQPLTHRALLRLLY